ncbi:MAG: prepilin-type N-terminal cleavage/methylation domain-containing protein [Pseudohongiellaceae bacterium]
MNKNCTHHGFTLIEVVIALTILSWVLGSVLFLVSQYADERLMMRERFYGNQVAWNQLMNNYQKSKGWIAPTQSIEVELNGREEQSGQNWDWQLEVVPAIGIDLFRYQSHVSSSSGSGIESSLTMYLLNAQNGQDRTSQESGINL